MVEQVKGLYEVARHPSVLIQPCLDAIHRGHSGECAGRVAVDIGAIVLAKRLGVPPEGRAVVGAETAEGAGEVFARLNAIRAETGTDVAARFELGSESFVGTNLARGNPPIKGTFRSLPSTLKETLSRKR